MGALVCVGIWTTQTTSGRLQDLRVELDSLKRADHPGSSETAEIAELQERVVELEEANEEMRRAMEGMSHTLSISLAQIMREQNPVEYEKQIAARHRMSCVMNLRQIDGAKEQWAIDNKKGKEAIPTKSDLYGGNLHILGEPSCPENGRYSINAVDELPTCTVEGHAIKR